MLALRPVQIEQSQSLAIGIVKALGAVGNNLGIREAKLVPFRIGPFGLAAAFAREMGFGGIVFAPFSRFGSIRNAEKKLREGVRLEDLQP